MTDAAPTLDTLKDKTLVIKGDFRRWPERLGKSPSKAAEARGATVVGLVSAEVDAVVIGDKASEDLRKSLEDEVAALNADGASIALLDEAGLRRLFRFNPKNKRFVFVGGMAHRTTITGLSKAELLAAVGAERVEQVKASVDAVVYGPEATLNRDRDLRRARELDQAGAGIAVMSEVEFYQLLGDAPNPPDRDTRAGRFMEMLSFCDPEGLAAALSVFENPAFQRLERETLYVSEDRSQILSQFEDHGQDSGADSGAAGDMLYRTVILSSGEFSCEDSEMNPKRRKVCARRVRFGACRHLHALLLILGMQGLEPVHPPKPKSETGFPQRPPKGPPPSMDELRRMAGWLRLGTPVRHETTGVQGHDAFSFPPEGYSILD